VEVQADSLPVEIDSLGFEVVRITSDTYVYHFLHNFKDIKGRNEIALKFEVGFELYNSVKDLEAGRYESVWQGFRTVRHTLADIQRYGYMHPVYGFVREYAVQFIGLPKDKLIVFSVKAEDDAGNETPWVRSIEKVPWAPEPLQQPFYVIREE